MNFKSLSRLFIIFHLIGDSFFKVRDFVRVVQKFVTGKEPENCRVKFKKRAHQEDDHDDFQYQSFKAESESILHICPTLNMNWKEIVEEVNFFGIKCGVPITTVLISDRTECRFCKRQLFVEEKSHAVVVYSTMGTYLGSRVTKHCRNCKVHEYYDYWTKDGERHYDMNTDKQFLLSTEETAFERDLLDNYTNLLVVGALPFSTFSSAYNRKYTYKEQTNEEGIDCPMKRKRR